MLAYGSKKMKRSMVALHKAYPTLDIIYLGGVSEGNIEVVLDQVTCYIYFGPANDPYFTYDMWKRHKHKIIDVTTLFIDNDNFRAGTLDIHVLASAIAQSIAFNYLTKEKK